MEESYRYKWQMFVEIGFLLMLIFSIFLPCICISGENYFETVNSGNEYALSRLENKTLKKNESKEEIKEQKKALKDLIKANKDDKKKIVKNYNKQIDKKITSKNMNRLKLMIKSLSVSKKPEFEKVLNVIVYKQDGKYSSDTNFIKKNKKNLNESMEESGYAASIQVMGQLLIIPILLAIFTIIYILIKRKTASKLFMADAAITIFCELYLRFGTGDMIYDEVNEFLGSLDLMYIKDLNGNIVRNYLDVSGVKKYTISRFFDFSMSYTWLLIVCFASIMFIFGIMFQTVWKPKPEPYSDEDLQRLLYDAKRIYTDTCLLPSDGHKDDVSQTPVISVEGKMRGICGEYKDVEIPVYSDKGVLCGRDPGICTLVFTNAKVSRKHCHISFDTDTCSYIVKNYSKNSIFASNGEIINMGEYKMYQSGVSIRFGTTEEFMLM